MKRIFIYNLFLSLCCSLVFFSSCTDESFEGGNAIDLEDEVEVTFQYELSGMSIPETRQIFVSEANMNKITSVILLVYSIDDEGDEAFAYQRNVISHTQNNNTGSFKVRLARSKGNQKYSIDFLFNPPTTVLNSLKTIAIGTKREEVRAACSFNGYSFTNGEFPMWAGVEPMEITSDTYFSDLTVIRSVARVDVGLNLNENDVATALSNFTLTSVRYVYMASNCYQIPDRTKLQGNKVMEFSLPPGVTYALNTSTTIARTITNGDNCVIAGLFPPESQGNFMGANSRQHFSIIIGGNYTDPAGNTSTNYYKIALTDPNDPEKRIDILRNHKYRVNILHIDGPGHSTPALAQTSANATNIIYELTVHEQGNINHIVYNNSNYLGVSTVQLECAPGGGKTEMKVKTNAGGGWKVTLTDEDGGKPNWITVTPTGSTSTSIQNITLTSTVNAGAPRFAILTFTAGALSITVRVIQNGTWYIYSDYTSGMLMNGDGDGYDVYVYGNVPANLKVRAYGPLKDLAISYDMLTYAGGIVPEGSPQVQELGIIGNAWIPMRIRDVEFQYSTDDGTNWVTFQEGLQGKGHYRLRSSGRIVSLYDYTPGTGYTWSQAMGIDPAWDYVGANVFYYRDISLPYTFPWTVPINGCALASGNNRNGLYYVPDRMTGCADYGEEGYETQYPKGRWRLPSVQEVLEMYQYRDHIGDIAIQGEKYWTSTDQNVTGGSYGGSFYIYINNPTTGLESQPTGVSTRRWDLYHVRCVYDDPDTDVILEQYPNWLYNPNRTFED